MNFVVIKDGKPTVTFPMGMLCDSLRMINDALKTKTYRAQLIEKGGKLLAESPQLGEKGGE